MMMTPVVGPNKRAKGEGSVYEQRNGLWAASLPLPDRDGKRRRKIKYAKTEPLAKKALTQMRRERDAAGGDLATGGVTVEQWFTRWFDEIAVKEYKPKTAANFRAIIHNHIVPAIGKVQLEKLQPTHIRKVEAAIEAKGIGSATSVLAFRVTAIVMGAAVREGLVQRNVTDRAKAPRKALKDITVLSAAEGVKVLQTVANDRLGTRWAAALFTGGRQGEMLGLELDRVSDDLDLSWQLQRVSWQHGCGPMMREEKYTNAAGKPATRQIWPCSAGVPSDCPERKVVFPRDSEHRYLNGGLWLVRPKSKAGYRLIPMPDVLRTIIERRVDAAQSEPNPHGLLWTADPKKDRHGRLLPLDGSPIDPGRDNKAWTEVLERAGVPKVKLHSARHTAASLLLASNTPEPVIMRILGHSSYATSKGYMTIDRGQMLESLSRMSALMQLPPNSGGE